MVETIYLKISGFARNRLLSDISMTNFDDLSFGEDWQVPWLIDPQELKELRSICGRGHDIFVQVAELTNVNKSTWYPFSTLTRIPALVAFFTLIVCPILFFSSS